MAATDISKQSRKKGLVRAALIVLALLLIVGGYWYLTEGWAWLYGTEAYVYGFPMMMMDLTKDTSTAVVHTRRDHRSCQPILRHDALPGCFVSGRSSEPASTHLFAVSWADLDKEPLVLSVPDTNGRYYVIALFDMWSNVFASIGKRTTGTSAANFLIAGPGWQGTPPADVKQVFRSPTRFVWVNGQMQAERTTRLRGGERAAEAIQAHATQLLGPALRSTSQTCRSPQALTRKPRHSEQVQKMDAGTYFGRLAHLMKDNPPAAADAPMVEKLKRLGIEPGKDFDITKIDPTYSERIATSDGRLRSIWKKASRN